MKQKVFNTHKALFKNLFTNYAVPMVVSNTDYINLKPLVKAGYLQRCKSDERHKIIKPTAKLYVRYYQEV